MAQCPPKYALGVEIFGRLFCLYLPAQKFYGLKDYQLTVDSTNKD